MRCANALKAVNPDAVVERKKLPPAAQAEIHRVLNNMNTWQLEDKCNNCGSREFRAPEHQQKLDAAMRQFAQTAGQLEWPELVPVECSRCKEWRKPMWSGMPEEFQRLETQQAEYHEHTMRMTFKRLCDTVDPEEYERVRERHEGKRQRKVYTVGDGKVAEEDGKEVAKEYGEEVAQKGDEEVAQEDSGGVSESD